MFGLLSGSLVFFFVFLPFFFSFFLFCFSIENFSAAAEGAPAAAASAASGRQPSEGPRGVGNKFQNIYIYIYDNKNKKSTIQKKKSLIDKKE